VARRAAVAVLRVGVGLGFEGAQSGVGNLQSL